MHRHGRRGRSHRRRRPPHCPEGVRVRGSDSLSFSLASGSPWTSLSFDLDVAESIAEPIALRAELRTSTYAEHDAIVLDAKTLAPLYSVDALRLLEIAPTQHQIRIGSGDAAVLTIDLRSAAAFDIHGRLQLLSPWGSWDWFDDWSHPIDLAPREQRRIIVPLRPPARSMVVDTWIVPKATWFGMVQYGRAIAVTSEDAS